MANLQSIIDRIRKKQADESDWLYIVGPAQQPTLAKEADLGGGEIDESSDEEIEPVGFAERGLKSTIDVQEIEDCIHWADRLSGSQDSSAALDVIRYLIRFDAFPDTLNCPDPPSRDIYCFASTVSSATNSGRKIRWSNAAVMDAIEVL